MTDHIPSLDPAIADLLVRRWTGVADAADAGRYAAWLAESTDNAVLAEQAEAVWRAAAPASVEARIDVRARVWERIRQPIALSIGAGHATPVRPPVIIRPRRSTWRTLAIPLVGLGLAAAAALVFIRTGIQALVQSSDEATRLYSTGPAQHATLDLPHGVRVMLAPQSRIEYRAGRRGERQVALSGEAYFTVASDPARPFVVRSRHATVRVLGTAFDVRAYPSDSLTAVSVRTGKVAVGRARTSALASAGAPLVLAAGRAAEVGDSVRVRPVDVAAPAWTEGRLEFANTPVPAFLDALSRWYGYEFRVADSTLRTRHVTTTLTLDTAAQTMKVVRDLLEVTMTFEGNVVVLTPQSRSSSPSPARTAPRARDAFSSPSEVGK